MIFDTDILIWVQRGNLKAAKLIDQTEERAISMQTYLELIQCAQNKQQIQLTKDFLMNYGFNVIPFTQNIGHRAAIYLETHTLATGLRAGDAIVAATAAENNLALATGNSKHFKTIVDLKLHIFKP